MTYERLTDAADERGLLVMGAFHPAGAPGGTLILLGAGAGFWPTFTASAEVADGLADPIDRWSTRVIGTLATRFGASALFPFGGPPHQPFIDWALQSGRAFTSPTGMLVHDTVGLMISYRGALHFTDKLAIPQVTAASPCVTCAERPCTTVCPVGALGADHDYDLNACHGYLDIDAGRDCMMMGCATRRACPISTGAGRQRAQSALHMKAFHST